MKKAASLNCSFLTPNCNVCNIVKLILFHMPKEEITSNAPFFSRNPPFILLSPHLILNAPFTLNCSLINDLDEATVFIGFNLFTY